MFGYELAKMERRYIYLSSLVGGFSLSWNSWLKEMVRFLI